MADGKVIVTGSYFDEGFPNERVAVFNPSDNSWNPQTNYWMNRVRYYPTTIRMPYGEIITAGGMDEENTSTGWIDDGPFEYNTNIETALSSWILGTQVDYDLLNYPHIFPMSATEVFFAGPARHNDNNNGSYDTFSFPMSSTSEQDLRVPLGGPTQIWEGSCSVMIRPRKVFKAGGYDDALDGDPDASDRTELIDLLGDGGWAQKDSLNAARIDFNLVLMPDGKVMALGGSTHHNEPSSAVYTTEIYDLTANTWTTGPSSSSSAFRGYHSTAALMPDGRVVLAGSDNQGSAGASAQIYTPAYCSGGTRPSITSAPDAISLGYGRTFQITVSDADANEVCLVALTATTHGFDANQRYIPLTVTAGSSSTTKTISCPTNATDAPVGYYMLFVLKPNGNGKLLCNLAKYLKVEVITD
jgi:hypothetical protein